jgi:Tfp pilus assembly protein PilF
VQTSSSTSTSSSTPTTTTTTLTPQQAVEHATHLFNSGDRSSALSLLQRVALASPSLPEAHFYLAAIHQAGGDFLPSRAAYRRALELDPSRADAHCNLGKLHSDHGSPPELAAAAYAQALFLDPSHLQARINAGLHHHGLGEAAEAVRHYEVGLRHHPGSDELHYNLAVALAHKGSVVEAVEHYRLAIQARRDVSQDHPEAWLNLAALHHRHGTLEDALWHYNRTVAAVLPPTLLGATLQAAISGLRPLAQDPALLRPVTDDPFLFEMLPMVLNNMGQALAALGRVREASVYHRNALALFEGRRADRDVGEEERRQVNDDVSEFVNS